MKFFSKNGKKKLVNAFAGITAVCFSPALSGIIVNNADNISYSVTSTLLSVHEYVESEAEAASRIEDDYKTYTEKPPALLLNPFYPEISREELDLNLAEDTDENQNVAVMSFNMANFKEDIGIFNSRDGRIVNKTYKPVSGDNFINLKKAGQVRNATSLPNEFVRNIVNSSPDIKLELGSEPEVLIIHTHTSESFQPPKSRYYDEQYSNRSNDSAYNVVSVGAEIAAVLADHGISVIHDGTIHDYPEYSGAYNRSAVTVSELLQMNPSIKIVLDVHRDAIKEGDAPIAAVTEINGIQAAQVMIISAADNNEYDMPDYLENLKFAAYLQNQIESDSPGLTRPVLFQYCHYNQDLSIGSLLLEIGSHGNTIDEAKYTGRLIGESIAKALISLKES